MAITDTESAPSAFGAAPFTRNFDDGVPHAALSRLPALHGEASRNMQLSRFLARSPLLAFVTAPVIYSMIVPVVLLDAWASAYQAICFRAYRIPRVKRSAYVLLDRRHLAYLNWIEALNCLFCGYANGVFAYVREIGGRTEQFWCPIKHALKISDPHQRYYQFLEYGDADGYRERLGAFRDQLRAETAAA